MSAPESPPEVHPVIGVAQMFCDKCGFEMLVQTDGRDPHGHVAFKATCATCDVVVAVPVMVADAAVRKLS